MRVAISAALWGGTPFRQVAQEANEAGYAGIEGVGDLFGELGLARALVHDHGLEVVAGRYAANWFSDLYRDIELDQLRRVAEFYAELGAKQLITFSRPVPERLETAGHHVGERDDGLLEYQWGYLADSLAMATFIAEREFDMRLLFKNQLGSLIENGPEMDQLLALTDPEALFLAPDLGHLMYAGVEPLPFLRRTADRVRHLVLQDLDADLRDQHLATRGDVHTFADDGGFVELGQGDVDVEGAVDLLRERGFDGWVVAEQERTLRDPSASAQISREYLVGIGLGLESEPELEAG